ncbi:MAG: DNA topoisomerase VI subunit B, partial [Nitrososphaerota archaeon]|nr:DNA topoisomerase VI subunit B [Nitrososphaerota archaeon]
MVTFSEISPSEFFYRNRDLAGFTNPARALYMAVRELVENSLDACELTRMLPDIYVRIVPDGQGGETSEPRAYRVTVADNGPGVDP